MIGTDDVLWVELTVQRRLCPIFVSRVGLPDIHEYSAGGRVVNGPPGLGRHILVSELRYTITCSVLGMGLGYAVVV